VTECDIIELARSYYKRRCTQNGWVFQQPSAWSSTVVGSEVILSNGAGIITRYLIGQILPSGRPQLSAVPFTTDAIRIIREVC